MTILSFPRSGGHQPVPEIIVTPRSLSAATDWQAAVALECRRHDGINPRLVGNLKAAGLLPRCTFLACTDGGALRFRYIGVPTQVALGPAWCRSMLDKPEGDDPHARFADAVGRQYGHAIGSGEVLLNHITVTGIGRGFAYTHLLVGFTDGRQRRAVLSAIDLRGATVH